MVTESIIKVLRNDATLRTLLGASSANDSPIFSTDNFDDTVDKQVNVEVNYGASIAFEQTAQTHDGTLRVYVLVKDTIVEPIKSLNSVVERILALLDLKGTSLDTDRTIYWIQKLNSDFTHYEDIKFYEVALQFRFVYTE
jgi:hypothetical protein